jgi:hypothetical protein
MLPRVTSEHGATAMVTHRLLLVLDDLDPA